MGLQNSQFDTITGNICLSVFSPMLSFKKEKMLSLLFEDKL